MRCSYLRFKLTSKYSTVEKFCGHSYNLMGKNLSFGSGGGTSLPQNFNVSFVICRTLSGFRFWAIFFRNSSFFWNKRDKNQTPIDKRVCRNTATLSTWTFYLLRVCPKSIRGYTWPCSPKNRIPVPNSWLTDQLRLQVVKQNL